MITRGTPISGNLHMDVTYIQIVTKSWYRIPTDEWHGFGLDNLMVAAGTAGHAGGYRRNCAGRPAVSSIVGASAEDSRDQDAFRFLDECHCLAVLSLVLGLSNGSFSALHMDVWGVFRWPPTCIMSRQCRTLLQEVVGARRGQDEGGPGRDKIRQPGKLLRLDSGRTKLKEDRFDPPKNLHSCRPSYPELLIGIMHGQRLHFRFNTTVLCSFPTCQPRVISDQGNESFWPENARVIPGSHKIFFPFSSFSISFSHEFDYHNG